MMFWLSAFKNSLILVFFVSLLSVSFGTVCAWLLARSTVYGSSALKLLFSLGYALPSYLIAIAWIILANPTVGWLNFGIFNIYTMAGFIFIESSIFFSLVFLNLSTVLNKVDSSLLEAAKVYGASPLQIFLKIDLPLMRDEIKNLSLIVALATFSSFGVAALIGAPARVFVLTTALYSSLKQGSVSSFNEALMVAFLMALVSLVVVFFTQKKAWAGPSKAQKVTRAPSKLDLSAFYKLTFSAFLFFLATLCILLPAGALFLSSLQSDASSLALKGLSFKNWSYFFFSLPGVSEASRNSFYIATIATLFMLAFSFFYAIRKPQAKAFEWLRLATSFFYSTPGTVLALFLIFIDRKFLSGSMADTFYILIFAMFLKYVALALGSMLAAAEKLDRSLLEAADIYGARVQHKVFYIWWPHLKNTLATGFIIIFFPCFLEVTMSLLLSGPGTENLGVLLFQLQDYADRSSAAVLASLLLLFSLLGFLLHKKWDVRHGY